MRWIVRLCTLPKPWRPYADLGEGIVHGYPYLAEIAAKENELEQERASRKQAIQQAIIPLEDQIKVLEDDRARLRADHNWVILNKQADDAAIIQQDKLVDKLTAQIEELKAQVKEVTVEVEVEKLMHKPSSAIRSNPPHA